MLTHKKLIEILHYDRDSGIFTWKSTIGQRAIKGNVAGTISKIHGYQSITIYRKIYRSHCLAWFYITGSIPDKLIDHINRVRSDNRFCNLRLATNKQNTENAKIRKDSSSGFRGVSYRKDSKKWRSYISHNEKRIYLGDFDTKEEAALVSEAKRKELFTHYESKA